MQSKKKKRKIKKKATISHTVCQCVFRIHACMVICMGEVWQTKRGHYKHMSTHALFFFIQLNKFSQHWKKKQFYSIVHPSFGWYKILLATIEAFLFRLISNDKNFFFVELMWMTILNATCLKRWKWRNFFFSRFFFSHI